MQRRRQPRRGYRGAQRHGAKPNFIPVILILCLSVGCGYATAKYVVDPVVNYVPQIAAGSDVSDQSTQKQDGSAASDKAGSGKESKSKASSGVVEDEADVKETEVAGYAVQYGCYSGKAAAETAMSSLGISGLQVVEQNKMYKIIGEMFESKDKAKEALDSAGTDNAFVTTVYK